MLLEIAGVEMLLSHARKDGKTRKYYCLKSGEAMCCEPVKRLVLAGHGRRISKIVHHVYCSVHNKGEPFPEENSLVLEQDLCEMDIAEYPILA